MTRCCTYCLGYFNGRDGAETCSDACRKARSDAPRHDEVVMRPSTRRDSYSLQRAQATGFGTVTAGDAVRHDNRIRWALDIEGATTPHFGPGFSADDIGFEWMMAAKARRTA